MLITSLTNPKIKKIIKFRRTSARRKEKIIVIEGLSEIMAAVSSGIGVKEIFVCPDLAKAARIADAPHTELSQEVFRKVSLRENPDGFIAFAAQPDVLTFSSLILPDNPLLVVIERMEKPGNIGAILRTADGAGADAVLICDPRTDIYNPNVIRSSLGTVFTNMIAVGDTAEAAMFLKSKKIAVFAAFTDAKKVYSDCDFTGPAAIVIGTEHEGLSSVWRQNSCAVRIPMRGKADSLNASVSAAIILFEAARQRRLQ